MLRPGGVLLAFGITRYAGLIYGLTVGHVFDRDYMRMIAHEVRTGHRQNTPAWMATFPNAYFHLPMNSWPRCARAACAASAPWA